MKKFFGQLLLASILFFSQLLIASTDSPISALVSSDEDFNYDDFYKVQEVQASGRINLLKLAHYNQKFPLPTVPYKRDMHFGGWLRDTSDGSCLNTRGKVLVRDSVSTVSYTSNGCTVASGEWQEPYAARTHNLAKDIQIDHVVALKNAYMTGAFEWNFQKRCLYANYLGNNFHLLSVDGRENLKKSDYSPSGYVPPNRQFVCTFIKSWLNVKLIWSLRITPKEADAINKVAEDNNCDPRLFEVSADNLSEQRQFMEDHANLCAAATAQIENFQ